MNTVITRTLSARAFIGWMVAALALGLPLMWLDNTGVAFLVGSIFGTVFAQFAPKMAVKAVEDEASAQ